VLARLNPDSVRLGAELSLGSSQRDESNRSRPWEGRNRSRPWEGRNLDQAPFEFEGTLKRLNFSNLE
jgi:hypothetical protein